MLTARDNGFRSGSRILGMEAKRFLFCSLDAALIGDIAWQVAREGHDVRYHVAAESDREIADGFVEKTDDWEAEVDWADVIVFDDIWVGDEVGTGALAAELRHRPDRPEVTLGDRGRLVVVERGDRGDQGLGPRRILGHPAIASRVRPSSIRPG